MPKKTPYKYVIEDTDRKGNVRVYYRKPGQKKVRIQVSKDHPDWIDHYRAAQLGKPLPDPDKLPKDPAPAEGTLLALVKLYAVSSDCRAVNPLGQKTRVQIFESCCAEIHPTSGDPFGQMPAKYLQPKHIEHLKGLKAGLPGAANNRVKYLKVLFEWACKFGHMTSNPAARIDYLPPVRKDGHHTWTIRELKKFEKFHPLGTMPRLAFDLAIFTAARRSDLVKLGPDHVDDEMWLGFSQSKTGGSVEIPVLPPLARSISMTPRSALRKGHADTFLRTSFGKPYTADGLGNAFRAWCDKAGMPANCGLHGLRKAAAARLAELGCTTEQIKAVTGHATDKEVSRYTQGARRRVMAESAMQLVAKMLAISPTEGEHSKNDGTFSEGEKV